jgi:hypothetical protein
VTAHKRTEITVETDRIMIIRRQRSIRVWCQECGCEVDAVDLVEAGALTGMKGQALADCAQSRGWHVYEGQDGTGVICLESMLKAM